jgi:hypothetical protein
MRLSDAVAAADAADAADAAVAADAADSAVAVARRGERVFGVSERTVDVSFNAGR